MGKYRYITKRRLKNEDGEEKGKILVTVKKNSDQANVKYTCPQCENEGQKTKEWKRPFSIRCENCGHRITVPRIKSQMKKERKKKRKKAGKS